MGKEVERSGGAHPHNVMRRVCLSLEWLQFRVVMVSCRGGVGGDTLGVGFYLEPEGGMCAR